MAEGNEIIAWIEKNPVPSIAIGAVVVIGGMYLLGYFTPAQSSSGGSQNLAAAYYAAEAATATAGTQLQMETVRDTNQTAQVTAQANAAQAIASTEANMYTTLGGQTAGTATTLYNDELLSSQTNANDAMQTANVNADYAYRTSLAGTNAGILQSAFNTIIPQELALSGGGAGFSLPGVGTIWTQGGAVSPSVLAAQGYTPDQIASIVARQ
jgi:hypothetical protein